MSELSRQELMFLVEPCRVHRSDTQYCMDNNPAKEALVKSKDVSIVVKNQRPLVVLVCVSF